MMFMDLVSQKQNTEQILELLNFPLNQEELRDFQQALDVAPKAIGRDAGFICRLLHGHEPSLLEI